MAQQEDISKLYDEVLAHQKDITLPWKYIILSWLDPFESAFSIVRKGARPVLKYIWSHPFSILSPSTLQSQLSAAAMPWFMAEVDASMTELKQSLVNEASGVVLEIGAGTGETLKYYNTERVEKIYGVEPNLEKCAVLRGESERLGIQEKYEVVPHGIESFKELEELGILPGSIDTIVAIHCLCSIPDATRTIQQLYKLLKPGGQFIICEHIVSTSRFTRILQWIYTNTFWRFVLDGCEMHRDTLRWILEAAIQDGGEGWDMVDLNCYDGWWALFPRIFGICFKVGGPPRKCTCSDCECEESGEDGEAEEAVADGEDAEEEETVASATVDN